MFADRLTPLPLLAAAAIAATGLGLGSCESVEPAEDREQRRVLTMEMFRELIEQGTLQPVDSMEDAFDGIEPDMGATPEERRPRPDAEPAAEAAPPAEPGGAPAGAGPEPGPGELGAEPEPEPEPVEISPFLEFGSRIKVYPDAGLIMKPYPMRPGMGEKLAQLIEQYGDFLIYAAEQGPQDPSTVRLDVRKDFDTEMLSPNIRQPAPAQSTEIKLADWLIVTASKDNLREVEYFIDLFAGGPPQIEIEAKIVEWVTRDSFDWGITNSFDSDGNPIPMVGFPEKTLVDALNWNLPNNSGTNQFMAGFSAIHDGVSYAATIELLATYENVSIISRPKVAVREGGRAQLTAVTEIPFLDITGINPTGTQNARITYKEVGVKLYVTPRLIGTKTVSLEIDIEASQQTGSQTTSAIGGDPIQTPVLSTRSANTVVYLKPGQAVIIGGLITERSVEEERKVPFLGDIPLLGYLFKSTSQVSEKAQVLFFIRPRVLEGTDFTREY